MKNKTNYKEYLIKLEKQLQNETLKPYKIHKSILSKTEYNYPIYYISIGEGKKDIFLIGGTHGSEIITTDYLLQLIENIPKLENFDPNIFTLKIIPLLNPEGYNISTNTFQNIKEEDFYKKSYEYYLRYRTDMIIYQAINELKKELVKDSIYTPSVLLEKLKTFVQTNPKWALLSEGRVFSKINILNQEIQKIKDIQTTPELCGELINKIKTIENSLYQGNIFDKMYTFFLLELEDILIELLIERKNYITYKKLYQDMFATSTFEGLESHSLSRNLKEMYKFYDHPLGSQICFDATGIGVNLNANQPFNNGINIMKNNETLYGPSPKDNIQKYVPGPIGASTIDAEQFHFTKENIALQQLLKDSNESGRYTMTLLYHSTGGLIYYKPYQDLMESKQYLDYLNYNQELATLYEEKSHYKILETSSTSGFGDFLRREYPGVLLIELSKMGGNPLGPYGDINNLYQVYHDNNQSLDQILDFLKKKNLSKIRKK